MLNKITGYDGIKSSGAVKRRAGVSAASSFADILSAAGADDVSSTASIGDIAATGAVSHMLALQEISEEEVRRKKLAQQGKNMLDSLEALRRQLLAGAIPAHTLTDLQRQLSTQRQMVNDPALTAILDDIELRVAVELAKLEKAAEGLI